MIGVLDIDFVKIDPNSDEHLSKFRILKNGILNYMNVRAGTPLDNITNYFCHKIRDNLDITSCNLICYNIITDGEPNNKLAFVNYLKKFCIKASLFSWLLIYVLMMLISFNDLDKKYWHCCFLTYTNDLHICRMAGCNSIAADLLDDDESYPSLY